MMTVVKRSMPVSAALAGAVSDYLHGHVGRIGDDVEYRRTLLRLCDERLDILLRSIGIDMKRHLDVVISVADVAVDAQDTGNIHLALESRFHRTQLNPAILRDCCNAGGQTARKTDEDDLNRGRTVVLRGEDLWVIRFK